MSEPGSPLCRLPRGPSFSPSSCTTLSNSEPLARPFSSSKPCGPLLNQEGALNAGQAEVEDRLPTGGLVLGEEGWELGLLGVGGTGLSTGALSRPLPPVKFSSSPALSTHLASLLRKPLPPTPTPIRSLGRGEAGVTRPRPPGPCLQDGRAFLAPGWAGTHSPDAGTAQQHRECGGMVRPVRLGCCRERAPGLAGARGYRHVWTPG